MEIAAVMFAIPLIVIAMAFGSCAEERTKVEMAKMHFCKGPDNNWAPCPEKKP